MSGEQTDLATTQPDPTALVAIERAGFTTTAGFALLQRGAQLLATSTLLPDTYYGNLANCAIVLELAQRLQASPVMVAQNLYIVHGRPGWSSQFLIASVNQCGRFSALQFEWSGAAGSDEWSCRAWAKELRTESIVRGPWVTIAMAKAEGWFNKQGSKWKTIPELMLMYRAATFFARTHAPELTMGLPTREEVQDTIDVEAVDTETGEILGRKPTLVKMPQRRPAAATDTQPQTTTTSEPASDAAAPSSQSPSSAGHGPADPAPPTTPTQSDGGPAPDQQQAPAVPPAPAASAPAPAQTEPAKQAKGNGTSNSLPKPLQWVKGQAYRVLRVWQPNPQKNAHLVETSGGLALVYSKTAIAALENATKGNASVQLQCSASNWEPAPWRIDSVTLDLAATAKGAAGPKPIAPAAPVRASDINFGEGFTRREREPGEDDQ